MLQYLCYFYKSATGRDGMHNEQFHMKIDWGSIEDRYVFELARVIRLKEVKKLSFTNIHTEESKNILDYLHTNCPKKLRAFKLDATTVGGVYCSGDFYAKGILKAASLTCKEVCISCFKLSKKTFQEIIKASSNCDRVAFEYCVIDLNSSIDLSGPKYNTTCLVFKSVGNQLRNNWEKYPERLKRVIKAISLCSLATSLKKLSLLNCDIDEENVDKMLEEFGLDSKINIKREFDEIIFY